MYRTCLASSQKRHGNSDMVTRHSFSGSQLFIPTQIAAASQLTTPYLQSSSWTKKIKRQQSSCSCSQLLTSYTTLTKPPQNSRHNTKIMPPTKTSFVPTGHVPKSNLPDHRHLPPNLSLPIASSIRGRRHRHSDVSMPSLCSFWQL